MVHRHQMANSRLANCANSFPPTPSPTLFVVVPHSSVMAHGIRKKTVFEVDFDCLCDWLPFSDNCRTLLNKRMPSFFKDPLGICGSLGFHCPN